MVNSYSQLGPYINMSQWHDSMGPGMVQMSLHSFARAFADCSHEILWYWLILLL